MRRDAVFDAVEQARVESIGSRRMSGMAGNITAMLEDRYHRGGRYEEITDRADAPLEDAVALMVPRAPDRPEAAQGGREDRRALARADRGQGRQRSRPSGRRRSRTSAASPAHVRDMLAALDMADQSAQGRRVGRGRGQSGPVSLRISSSRKARPSRRAGRTRFRGRGQRGRDRGAAGGRFEAADAPAGDWDEEDEASRIRGGWRGAASA